MREGEGVGGRSGARRNAVFMDEKEEREGEERKGRRGAS